jgi:osmoprotectant transport system ATP-binding protein
LKIADLIIVMQNGKIIQQGSPDQILRHPANDFVRGFIGEKRLSSYLALSVDDVMLTDPVTVFPARGLAEAVQLMHRKRVTGLLVVDKDRNYLGKATTSDIYEKYREESLTVRDVMKSEGATVLTGTPLAEAIPLVQETPYGYVPVVTPEGKLAGLLTRASLVEVLAKPYLEEVVAGE